MYLSYDAKYFKKYFCQLYTKKIRTVSQFIQLTIFIVKKDDFIFILDLNICANLLSVCLLEYLGGSAVTN